MLKRLEIFLIGAVFFLLTAMILIVYSVQRVQEFKNHHNDIQKTSVKGAAYAINLKLKEKRRHVRLFTDEYSPQFFRLMNFPNDDKTKNSIEKRLKQRFSDFFTFTITDNKAQPVLENIESFVGHACQLDLSNFAKTVSANKTFNNKIFIHPQPLHYHYDVMAPLHTRSDTRVFFISFYLNEIADILKTHELPGQNLMLVRRSHPGLIEVTSQAARDKIKRDIHLSAEEKSHINVSENIPDTDWRLVNVADSAYEKKYLKNLWNEAIIIMLVVLVALVLLVLIVNKTARSKE